MNENLSLYEIQTILTKRVGVLLKQNEACETELANEETDGLTKSMLSNKVHDNLIRLDEIQELLEQL